MRTRWQLVCCAFSGEDEEEEVVCQDSQVTQEMLEEQLVRLLTREVLDLLCKCRPLDRSITSEPSSDISLQVSSKLFYKEIQLKI